jgi:hypothetical protein
MVLDAWTRHMGRGEFERAWAISDAVLQRRRGLTSSHLPRHEQWIWDGTPLHGKRVLVRCYHGLGDTIQFIRYTPLLRAIASRVIVWMPAALIPLFADMPGIDQLLPLHDGTPDCDYDADVEVMELPHVFRTTVATIPRAVPYVTLPVVRDTAGSLGAATASAETAALPSRKDLAIVVFPRSGDWDPGRDVPIHEIARLAAVPGVSLHALSRDAGWAAANAAFAIVDSPDTVPATARVLGAADLVVSVDSMPAHLAGAMGVPVWTLLQACADWRWMEGRDDSPWYPSMRLFRQPEPGRWTAVVDAVIESLTRRSPAARAVPLPRAAPR